MQHTHRYRCRFGALALAACAALSHASDRFAEDTMNQHATGPFDVKLATLEPYNKSDATMARRSLDKQFHGDLDAASQGEMLSVGTARDNAGYVAIERVTGKLHGRAGSFALQHNATMTQGVPYLNIIVVPGSGTDELKGLSGSMKIDIAPGGAHSYRFEYTLQPDG
jgi:hypothetical protein